MDFIKENWDKVLTIFFAFWSTVATISSAYFAKQSSKFSKKANELTEEIKYQNTFHGDGKLFINKEIYSGSKEDFVHITFVNTSNVEGVVDFLGVEIGYNLEDKEWNMYIPIRKARGGVMSYNHTQHYEDYPCRLSSKESIKLDFPISKYKEIISPHLNQNNGKIKRILCRFSTGEEYVYMINDEYLKMLFI